MKTCPHKNLYMHVYSRIHSSQKVETTQMSINQWLNKQMRYIHTMKFCLAIKRAAILMPAATGTNLKNTMLNEIDHSWETNACCHSHETLLRSAVVGGSWGMTTKWTWCVSCLFTYSVNSFTGVFSFQGYRSWSYFMIFIHIWLVVLLKV